MPSLWSKSLSRWIDETPLWKLLLITVAIVLSWAFLYWHGGGLRFSNGSAGVGFGDCVYMSVVTFTTLGYGDIVPVGYGKALACGEVLLGLLSVGIGITKLTSASQSYHLGQLYARDAQKRFEEYLADLRQLNEEYKEAAKNQAQGNPIQPSLGALHMRARKLLDRIRDYASFEITNGNLLRKMPTGVVAIVLRACAQIMPTVGVIANFSKSLHSQKQREMANALVVQAEELANLMFKNCDDRAIRAEAKGLMDRCSTVKRELDSVHRQVSTQFKKP